MVGACQIEQVAERQGNHGQPQKRNSAEWASMGLEMALKERDRDGWRWNLVPCLSKTPTGERA